MRHFLVSSALSALFITLAHAIPHNRHSHGSNSSAGYIGSNSNKQSSDTPSTHQSGGEDYVVIFNSSHPAPPHVEEVLSRLDLSPDHPDVHYTFNNSAFRGFAASMKSHCIDALAKMTDVSIVEQSVRISSFAATTRSNSPWGLQRVSSANALRVSNAKALDFTYSFEDSRLGEGVDIYVVDTGVNVEHSVFGGRARVGFSFNPSDTTDGEGHGTHVSGTAAGSVLGVASGANIIGVKTLGSDGSGTTVNTINGIDWAVMNHDSRKNQPGFVGSVMSFSWGLEQYSQLVDSAIRSAIAAGIHVSVAAGNSGADSCSSSPSSSGGSNGPAITVGSIGPSNRISSFSNTGACNDLYAPGEDIVSAWNTGPDVIEGLDGTSMACPHVTGVMAYWMARNRTLAGDPAEMKRFLSETGLRGVVKGSARSGDPKILVNNGVTGAGNGGLLGSKLRMRTDGTVESEDQAKRGLSASGLAGAVSGAEDLVHKIGHGLKDIFGRRDDAGTDASPARLTLRLGGSVTRKLRY